MFFLSFVYLQSRIVSGIVKEYQALPNMYLRIYRHHHMRMYVESTALPAPTKE